MTLRFVDRARAFRRLVPATVIAVGLMTTPAGRVTAQRGPDEATRLLDGTIDIHVHSFPDVVQRSMDGVGVSQLAKAKNMRGLVLKNHYDQTAGLAYMVRQLVPGLEVFGAIDLNLTQGGMNAIAVEHMAKLSGGWGKVVWMSTNDSEYGVRRTGENRPFVPVSKNGELLQTTKDVIAVIQKYHLVLATGHVSPEEGLLMVREGKRQGVEHMLITHPMSQTVQMNIDQMIAATKEGAFLEVCGQSMLTEDAPERLKTFTEAIRRVGPQYIILSSDLGGRNAPLPPEGFGQFLVALKAKGFTEQELALMSKENPARLLGLK